MSGKCSHDEYNRQMVTPFIKSKVLRKFPVESLAVALKQDKHLNSIPLAAWDDLGHGLGIKWPEGDFDSMAGRVCVLKAAARMLIEEAQ